MNLIKLASLIASILIVRIDINAQTIPPTGESNDYNLGYQVGKSKWYFNYNILTPSGLIYFDQGKDDIPDNMGNYSRPDFYKDGSANFNVQVLSGDFFYGENWLRGGASAGLGISTNLSGGTNEAAYLIGNFGFALTFNQNIRLELGMSYGFSAKESYTIKYDNAIYVGLSFPTNLSENIKRGLQK